MTVEASSLWTVLAAATTTTLAIAILVGGVARTRGTWLFVALNIASACWSVTYFFQVNGSRFVPTGPMVAIYGNTLLAVNGVAVAAVFTYLALFSAWNAGERRWVSGRRLAVAHVPGAFYALGQATNPLHGWYISASEPGVWYAYGWLAYVNHTVAYVMLAVAVAIVLRAGVRGVGAFSLHQSILVAAGILSVMASGIVWTLRHVTDTAVSVNPAVLAAALLSVLLAVLTLRSPYGGLLPIQAHGAFDRMSDAAVVLAPGGRIVVCNAAFVTFAPFAEEGQRLETVSADLARLLDACGPELPCETELVTDEGVWWVRVLQASATSADRARLVLMTDLTSLRRAESTVAVLNQELAAYVSELEDASTVAEARLRELAAANERLAEATRTKDRFLANVSHELRTPLTSIIGLSSSLEAGRVGPQTEEQRAFARIIGDSGRHLLVLIEDILDLEKAASGTMDVRIEPVDLGQTVRTVAESLKNQYEERGLYLMVHVPECPLVVDTDERRVRQILFNLLGNAMKFTAEGGVRVRAQQVTDFVQIEVADSGIGIGPEDIERVFGEFEQVAGTDGSKSRGAGLGLSISRRLAHLIGGTLFLESEPGGGARFTLKVPGSEGVVGARQSEASTAR